MYYEISINPRKNLQYEKTPPGLQQAIYFISCWEEEEEEEEEEEKEEEKEKQDRKEEEEEGD